MQKRQLGPNGPMVSAVGIGAMSFSNFYGPTSEQASHAVLDAAMRLGIDHIDTANVYGMGVSETAIGSFLAARGAEARDHFRIATKAAITRDKSGARCFDNSKTHLEAELHGSLTRLGVEQVDLFYVHRRDPKVAIEEVTETLVGFIKAGKIRAFGYSEIAPQSLRRAAKVHPVAAVQSEYSLQTRAPDLGLVQECARQGTALVAFSPVGRGLLTDRPPTPESIAQSAFLSDNPRFSGANLTANLAATDKLRALAAEMGVATSALAIAWVLSRGDHVVAIPGTRSVAHLEEIASGAAMTLSEADLARIEAILPVGWAAGDRYSEAQTVGPERYS